MIRVLLADDHPIVREGITKQLDKADDIKIVGEARTGDECIQLVETLRPDVLLLDMSMPGLDGLEVATRLHDSHPGVKILVFSGYADDAFVFGALAAGAVGYLLKEDAPREIVSAVRAALRGKTVLSDQVAHKVARLAVGGENEDVPALTVRELQILRRVIQYRTNKEIAQELGLAERTIEYHLSRVYRKSGKKSRGEVARWALEQGLVGS